jgi:AcrR family transcriptional regulator
MPRRPRLVRRSGRAGRTRRSSPAVVARKAERREELLASAASAIASQGASISMDEIALACGVTKPILYRHFGDRNGLIRALAERFATTMFEQLDSALSASDEPRTLLVTTIDTYLGLLEREPDLYQFVTQRSIDTANTSDARNLVGDFQREVGRRVAVVMGERMRELGIDSGGVEPIAQGIVGLVHSAGDWWLERRSMPRSRLVRYVCDLLWNGLAGMARQEGAF